MFWHLKNVLVGFLSASVSLVLQNFKPYDFCFDKVFQIQKIFKLSSKTSSGSMYTLHISQGLKFYWYEILQQAKIENYEGIKFYNRLKTEIYENTEIYKKLKPIAYPKNATSLIEKKNSMCLLQELELVFKSFVLEFWF